MDKLVPEIFDLVDKAKSKDEKINLLRQHDSQPIRGLLRLNFDPNFNFDLPEGDPPYKKDVDRPIGYTETNLYTEVRRFYIWLQPQDGLTKLKKESLFINLLEGIHYTEAEVLLLCKDKNLKKKYKTIKEDLVREAYPTLLPAKVEAPKAPLA
jgi:hypothetical protein